MRLTKFCLGAVLAGLAAAAPAPANHVLHERRDYMPQKWVKRSKVDAAATLSVRIGMTQSNLESGPDLLMDVSGPESPNYGKWYTSEQIHELFAPAQHRVEAIRDWLMSAGVEGHRISQSVNKQWMQFDASIEELEDLLHTQYHVYEHSSSGAFTIACDEYYVPDHVRKHMDYITPGIKLSKPSRASGLESRAAPAKRPPKPSPPMKPMPSNWPTLTANPIDAICDVAVIPQCIQTMYNITPGTTAVAGNQLGIFEDLGDVYSQTDLNEFFQTLYPIIPQGTHPTLEGIDGGTAPNPVTSAGAESDLDFQISYPIIWPQGSVLFQTDDPYYEANYNYNGFLDNFFDAIDGSFCTYSAYGQTGNSNLDPPYPDPNPGGYKGNLQCGVYKPTNVISISYGGQESDLPPSYQERQCNEIMKLGMQGISIIVASGDSGVAGPAGDDNADGCLGNGQIFSPDFPATCPYITALGATYLPPGAKASQDQETAVTRFPSGGGFSNLYPIPSYQKAAVAAYFKNHNPSYPYYSTTNNSNPAATANGGIYNRIGRGYPDFSAVGDNVVIYYQGAPTLIGGTSASAPTFAAILTRINEARLSAGKSTIGFVNPTLYANPQVLHDITVGNNSGCGTAGFYAGTGWDPVTGLGTPDFPAMLSLFMGMK